MRRMRAPFAIAAALAATAPALAEIRLPAAFTDHMVIQRDRPVRVFGSAQNNKPYSIVSEASKCYE